MVLNRVLTNPSLRLSDLYIYVTPIKKNPDAQVGLPCTMMEQSEEWRNHRDRRMDKL
jgi:hypothetical protein